MDGKGTVLFAREAPCEVSDFAACLVEFPHPIERVGFVAGVILDGGKRLQFAGLFTTPATAPALNIATKMGCEVIDAQVGCQIKTGDAKQTQPTFCIRSPWPLRKA